MKCMRESEEIPRIFIRPREEQLDLGLTLCESEMSENKEKIKMEAEMS